MPKTLLRFITCGNVDDGKSTLIGRLLLGDRRDLRRPNRGSTKSESAKHGTTVATIDTALLLDGLEDERQQGITIDVAYRYFTSPTRKFIIADTPGHEQFTRNMATGASTADLAILLVDATKGVSTQTRRHAFIVSLLGIRQVVLAVNKMDLVEFSEEAFHQIRTDFERFAHELTIENIHAIPLSALAGDNVVSPSDRMTWYSGPTLFDQLNHVAVDTESKLSPCRLPIQWVNRPDSTFRGFSGTLASGHLRAGDKVTVLPSRLSTRVSRIVTMDGDLEESHAGDSVTVTLDDEIDIARGDMIVALDDQPTVSRNVNATLLWMSDTPLLLGKQYWLKHLTRRTSCEVQSIRYGVDINTLERRKVHSLSLNEIGNCQLMLHDEISYDPYHENRQTGALILVDRITNETVAAGMIVSQSSDPQTAGHWDGSHQLIQPRAASSLISDEERSIRYGQRPLTVLITGLSGSGKTSVALELEKHLFRAGRITLVLDGQTMRLGMSRDLGFSAEERSENLRRAAEIAKLINDAGQICIAAFVAPSRWVRDKARDLIGPESVFHVHLSTSIDVCRRRDITGQYQAADRGEITSFPGVTFAYEEPLDADMVIDTANSSPKETAEAIANRLGYFPEFVPSSGEKPSTSNRSPG